MENQPSITLLSCLGLSAQGQTACPHYRPEVANVPSLTLMSRGPESLRFLMSTVYSLGRPSLFFFGCVMQLAGSEFPNQGLNPGPQQ